MVYKLSGSECTALTLRCSVMFVCLLTTFSPSLVLARAGQADTEITLKKIMADPVWIGTSPASPRWSPDGSSLVYDIPQPEGRRQLTFRAEPGQPATIVPVDDAAIERHSFDRKVIAPNGDTVWSFAGNIYLRSEQEVRQLTRDTARQTAPGFLSDGNVFWQEDNSIVVYHTPTGTYREVASWRFEKTPTVSEPVDDFIGREQLALITTLSKKRSAAETSASEREALTEQSGAWGPKPFYLPEDAELIRASYSPAGRWLLLVTGTKVKKNPEDTIPHYVDDSGRIVHKPVRARVADAEPVSHQLWLADIQNHNLQALDLSTLPGYDEDVLKDVLKENARARSETYKSKRAARFIRLMTHRGAGNSDPVIWHPNGQQVALMLESWDNKDRWIVTLNAADDAPTLISQHRLHDQAWVNNYAFNEFGWLKGDPRLFYLSEESGYAHLYVREPGSKARQLTSGQFEVSDVTLSPDGDAFYFKSNKIHPGVHEIYRLPTEGGEPTQLTNFGGQTSYELSPDGEWLLLTSSRANQPPELFLSAAANASAPVQLTTTVTSEFLSYQWPEPEFVSFPVKGTRQAVHARLYLPEENRRNGAAVFFIHGAGYLQNSHKGWSDYFREYMFNVMLSRQGYVVMDIDYRASAGYGRDWRTAIYRDMGQPESEDFRAAIDYLASNHGVDPARVGAYGGSYGGFLVFNIMFRAPELFAAGAALRPVADWAHYNIGYTSNILNTPDIDPVAYRRSSPIYFAEGLQRPLLICAPMVDNNVMFQDSVRLVQRLIELEKTGFETAIYPVESHGFTEPSSWLDEYRRIYQLLRDNL